MLSRASVALTLCFSHALPIDSGQALQPMREEAGGSDLATIRRQNELEFADFSYFNTSLTPHQRSTKLMERINYKLFERAEAESHMSRALVATLLSCSDLTFGKGFCCGIHVSISFKKQCEDIMQGVKDAADAAAKPIKDALDAATQQVTKAQRVIKDVSGRVDTAYEAVEDLPTLLFAALDSAIKALASLDGCKLVDTAATEINKILDQYAKVNIDPTGCGDAQINTGSFEPLLQSTNVNVQQKTDVRLSLKLHGLKFSCGNMKKLLEAFIDQNPMSGLIREVLDDFQPIKTIKNLLQDAKNIVNKFSFWSMKMRNAVSLVQEETKLDHVAAQRAALESFEEERYGKALKLFESHELVSLDGHVVPKSYVNLEAMTAQFVDVGIKEVHRRMEAFMRQEHVQQELLAFTLIPIEEIWFTAELSSQAQFQVQAGIPFGVSKDLLNNVIEKLSFDFEIPVIPPVISARFVFNPSAQLNLILAAAASATATLLLAADQSVLSVNLAGVVTGTGPVASFQAPSFAESYIEPTGAVQLNAGLNLRTRLTVKMQICFFSTLCGGVSIDYDQDAAIGGDAALTPTAAPSSSNFGTGTTHYCEYTASDLQSYNSKLSDSSNTFVAAIGGWYYVTLPKVVVYPEVGIRACGVAHDAWLDTVRDKTFASLANDGLKLKQTAKEKQDEFKHWLTSDNVPFLLRDTKVMTWATSFGSSLSSCHPSANSNTIFIWPLSVCPPPSPPPSPPSPPPSPPSPSPPPPPPPFPSPPPSTSELPAGQCMYEGTLASPSGSAVLSLQSDGNLVIYKGSPPVAKWSTATAGTGATHLCMQTDGNLVLYSPTHAVWGNHMQFHGACSAAVCSVLVMQDDGNLVQYKGGTAIWSTNTH